MSQLYTYSDPVLSLWQAAVAEVQRRHRSMQARMNAVTGPRALGALAPLRALPSEDDLMSAVHLIGAPLKKRQPVASEITTPRPAKPVTIAAAAAAPAALAVPAECAKLAAQFLWAEMKGSKGQSAQISGELKDSTCDPGWSECVAAYLAFKAQLSTLPYRPNLNPVFDLGTKTKLAILGDWGTGDAVAINLLQQVEKLQPEVLLHLGDVYYAGTQNEESSNFLDICRQILGSDIPIFSLAGNHDMYSGGAGYYGLVDKLGQQASYFCLQNSAWQFLAMDTGHNDNNPITVATNMTSLMTYQSWSEANWHLDKIQNAGTRRTVLLSHHQLFSPFGSVGSVNGQEYAYNPNLFANFQGVLDKIVYWFWGHEHTLAVFNSYMGLQRGRCVGASAVPVFTDQQSYTNADGLQTYNNAPLPAWDPNGQLGNNGTSYDNCFALMTLNGASANVEYYRVPILGTATKLAVTDAN